MLHNSNASLAKFIDWQKVAKKGTWKIYRPDEKSQKSTEKLELNFP